MRAYGRTCSRLLCAAALAIAVTAAVANSARAADAHPVGSGNVNPAGTPDANPAGGTDADPGSAKLCTLEEDVSLDMMTQPDGLVSIPARVAGHDVQLVVDTGSIYTSIGSEEQQAFGLKISSITMPEVMAGGVLAALVTDTNQFSMGAMTTNHMDLLVMPSRSLEYGADGFLGPNLMKNYDVEIDFYDGKFNLFSQDDCPGVAVYWTKDPFAQVPMTLDRQSHISIPVTLDGKSLTAMVDTGAASSFMTVGAARDVFGIDEKNPALKSMGVVELNGNMRVEVMHYPFAALSFEGVVVNNPDISIVPDKAVGEGGPQLTLGIGVLRQLRMYIRYKEKMLYLTAAEAH